MTNTQGCCNHEVSMHATIWRMLQIKGGQNAMYVASQICSVRRTCHFITWLPHPGRLRRRFKETDLAAAGDVVDSPTQTADWRG